MDYEKLLYPGCTGDFGDCGMREQQPGPKRAKHPSGIPLGFRTALATAVTEHHEQPGTAGAKQPEELLDLN